MISIHAPAKGATISPQTQIIGGCDFNPRSREGSDQLFVPILPCSAHYFNPRSREGSDQMHRLRFCHYRYFNPRSREGSDTAVSDIPRPTEQFQSTLPRRERHWSRSLSCRQ